MSVSSMLSVIASQYDSIVSRTDFIALAEAQVTRCWFKGKEDYAVALMTAHLISVFTPNYRKDGTGGAITSKKEGDLTISFAQSQNKDTDLNSTSYGLQFQRLAKAGGFIMSVTGGNDYVCSS